MLFMKDRLNTVIRSAAVVHFRISGGRPERGAAVHLTPTRYNCNRGIDSELM